MNSGKEKPTISHIGTRICMTMNSAPLDCPCQRASSELNNFYLVSKNKKNVFLLTYSLRLVIKLKLFQYIIISHNYKTGSNIFMRTKVNRGLKN
jgi:hypothetical protein